MFIAYMFVHCYVICNSPVYGGNKEYLLTYLLAYVYTYIGSAKLHFHVFFVNSQKTLYMYTWHDLRFET